MTKELKTTSFDYEGLDKDLKGKLVSLAGSIRRNTKEHLKYALEMGKDLTEANELMAKSGCEGTFGHWVKEELGISKQTAYNYMNSYARFGGNSQSLGLFTAEAIYLLSGESVPSDAIDSAINLANKGTRITKDRAEELKRKYQPHEQQPAESPNDDEPDDEDVADGEDTPVVSADRGGPSSDEQEEEGTEEAPAAAKLFAAAEKHYAALTQLLDQLNQLVPHHSKADAQESLNLSYLDFRAWKRKSGS